MTETLKVSLGSRFCLASKKNDFLIYRVFVKLNCRYLAPEYFQHGKVSDKTDIYAFGIVLLELLTGRKPIEGSRGPGEENLVLWVGHLPIFCLISHICL